MTTTTLTLILLLIMIASFVLSSIKLKSPDISMAVAAVVLAIAGTIAVPELGSPVRYLVEGLFVNLDLALLFIAASIFVNIYSHSGAIAAITRTVVEKVNNKWILLSIMGVLMLIPGALTGAGSVAIFVLGGLVNTVLEYLGITQRKRTVFICFFAMLSAACPPINLWTMLMTAQANMPYVGFTWLLLIPIVIAGAFTIVFVGWGAKPQNKEETLAKFPPKDPKLTWWRIALPFVAIIALFLLALYDPWGLPVLGLPLMFIIAAVVAFLCNPKKTTFKQYLGILDDTMEQVFPLVATVLSVGVLQESMTQIGVKGLIGVTFITMPMILIFIFVLFFAAFAQGSLSYGSAIIIGAPLVFMYNTMGFDTTIACAALSLMFPIGDCLPPSRITGRLTCETVGYKGSYMSFLKQVAIPCLVLGAIALVMFIHPAWFKFLK